MNYANYIAHCIEIARRGEYFVAPNPMVGAVLVRNEDEQVLAEGWHEFFGGPHAEVNCFRNYENAITNHQSPGTSSRQTGGVASAEKGNSPITNHQSPITNLKSCTLFVSLEPCSHYGKTPPCAKLIIEKGVGRVVVGMLDPNPLVAGKGVAMLREAGIDVEVGVLENECRELNKRFLCLHEQHRPYVLLKWAQTSDGFLDKIREITNHQSPMTNRLNGALAISTVETKALVHKMRAENMAIMVGTRTVLLDNPRLLNTHWEGRNPVRVTVDRHGVIPSDARIFSDETGGIAPFSGRETDKKWQFGSTPETTIVYRDRTDWPFILADLAARNIHSIMVEGGTTLLNHILSTGLWDEIHIEIAPEITIGTGVPAPDLSAFSIPLPDTFDLVDGHRLYTIYR